MQIPPFYANGAPHSADEIIRDTLHFVRTLLGMDVGFVSEFSDGRRIFRYVDSRDDFAPVCVGGSEPLEQSYCKRVVDGRLPELLQDARQNREALTLPVTTALPIGAHLSVPIRFSDGRLYGTFCCFSTTPDQTLNERDLRTLRLFADFVGKILEREANAAAVKNEIRSRLRAALDGKQYRIWYQPIINVAENRIVGYEALTRFLIEPIRTPDKWFNESLDVGLQVELEIAVLDKALSGLSHLPDNTYLSFNVSPETILQGSLNTLLKNYPLERLVLEVTEHASINDYSAVTAILAPFREKGLRLAVDDAGAGYASFRHILKLKPDVIKLDISLIQRIDIDQSCRALAAALIRFAEETGSKVLAEGVETYAEFDILRGLKVANAQGFLLGRPQPLSEQYS